MLGIATELPFTAKLPGKNRTTPPASARKTTVWIAWTARALARGLPIGSGMIESGHRHVLHARPKKAGTAWLKDHADQIAHLRFLRANQQKLAP